MPAPENFAVLVKSADAVLLHSARAARHFAECFAKGRKLDDLKWEPQDFTGDGVHPSDSGREKVARRLLEFFSTDPLARGWFAK